MMDHLLKEFISADGLQRVWIVKREDGSFSYRRVWDDNFEIADRPGPYCGIYDSAETAEAEARARVPWLAAISN
jgi:hypothetical protein